MMGPCKVRLYNEAGVMLELEGSYGMDDGEPVLVLENSKIPRDFKVIRMDVEPITVS
jgi:hypothetical protein